MPIKIEGESAMGWLNQWGVIHVEHLHSCVKKATSRLQDAIACNLSCGVLAVSLRLPWETRAPNLTPTEIQIANGWRNTFIS